MHEIVRNHSFAVSSLLHRLDRPDEIADMLSDLYPGTPGINLVPPWPSTEHASQASKMRDVALDRGLPAAMLITQAKSGSISVAQVLSHGFHLPAVVYALSVGRVIAPWALDLSRGGGSYVTHLNPTPKNVALLAASGIRHVMVHVRDPRGQLLSLLHHFSKYGTGNPAEEAKWQRMSFDEKFEMLAADALPLQVEWIRGWLGAREALNVSFTTYEQFARNPEAFVDLLVARYGGDTRFFDRDAALGRRAEIDYHFRKGKADSWKDELNATQIQRINAAIPGGFWREFGWTP